MSYPAGPRVAALVSGGKVYSVGAEGNLYSVGSNELAIIDPNDGSTIKSVPYLAEQGSNAILTRGVLWVNSWTQTFAYDASTLELLRVFDIAPPATAVPGSLGAFASDTAAINTGSSCAPTCTVGVSVFRSQTSSGTR